MDNPYYDYVQSIATEYDRAQEINVVGTTPVVEREHKVLLFSPHPDDECITGLLPRRFQLELGTEIINIPMTFGSNPQRRQGRLEELDHACAYLGWRNYLDNQSLENLTYSNVVSVLNQFQPVAIFFPHSADWNSRHIEVNQIVMEALAKMPLEFSTLAIETEFWGAMSDPNANVEGTPELVSDLVAATSLHVEEVDRNPYHLRLPAWMQDNVRRGAELVNGQGQVAPDFSFSTLYRIRQWQHGTMQYLYEGGKNIASGEEHVLEFALWK